MANNPYVNKVQFGNQVVMDISDTTATPSEVANGEVFYTASGARSVGTGALNFIDDTAGDGDTNKTWSADKLVDEFASHEPPTISVTPGTANTPTAVTLPTLTFALNGETLEISWTAGSVTPGVANTPTAVSVA